ncbi:MAG TPA: 30S ribosomal protein S21 [Anaerolineales bacterium]|nr:30S ribosomal protein S21 [Anaerolineales bacterium]
MTTVTLRPNETSDSLFRRFKRKVIKAGTLGETKRKRWFVPKGEARREARKKATRRMKRRQIVRDNER